MLDRLDLSDPWVREKTCNPEMCKACGGMCCKSCGCSFFPSQLEMNKKAIVEKEGITIAAIQALSVFQKLEKPVLFIRASNIGEGLLASRPLGPCKFLTDKGCSLSFKERPLGGALVVPFKGLGGCYNLYSDKEFIEMWQPYQQLLQEIVDEITGDC